MINKEFNTGDLVIWKPEIKKANEKANKSKAKNKWYRNDINRNSPDPYLWPMGILQITWGLNEPLINPGHWAGRDMVEVVEYPYSGSGRPIYAQVNISKLSPVAEVFEEQDLDLLVSLADIGL